MKSKICLVCNCRFIKNSNNQKFCSKDCYKIFYKHYYQIHRERIIKQFKKWREEHKNEIKNYKKKWNKNNPNYYKKYQELHKEELKEYNKKYDKQYQQTHKKEHREYEHNKKEKDINYKITAYLRTRIYHVLKGINKSKSTMKLLGCSIQQLKKHLENQFKKGMTWNNWGTGWYGKGKIEWHIDHIKPCASFDLTKPNEQLQCFNYINLQPLWAEENWSKNDIYKGVKKS